MAPSSVNFLLAIFLGYRTLYRDIFWTLKGGNPASNLLLATSKGVLSISCIQVSCQHLNCNPQEPSMNRLAVVVLVVQPNVAIQCRAAPKSMPAKTPDFALCLGRSLPSTHMRPAEISAPAPTRWFRPRQHLGTSDSWGPRAHRTASSPRPSPERTVSAH